MPKGSQHTRDLRRQQVVSLMLRGLRASEIAEQLHFNEATIYEDMKAIRQQWRETMQRTQNELLNEAIAKRLDIERDAFRLYYRPIGEEKDSTARRMMVMDRIIRINEGKERLHGLVKTIMQPEQAAEPFEEPESIIAGFINVLPADLRNAVLDYTKERAKLETPS